MGSMNSNTMMALGSLSQGANSFASGILNSSGEAEYGEWQKQQFEFNKQIAEMQSKDAIRRGDSEARKVRKAGKQIIGSQRAALAAQGIEIDSGSALDIQGDTAYLSEMDALTIKNNAAREAWGYKMDALQSGYQGQMAQYAAQNKARSTLLTGGLGFASGMMDGAYYLSKNNVDTKKKVGTTKVKP